MGSKIYPKVHENPRAFFSSSSASLLESSIQYPWGVGLHHHMFSFLEDASLSFRSHSRRMVGWEKRKIAYQNESLNPEELGG